MSLPNDRPCIFCNNGKYLELRPEKGYEDHEISTLVINKIGTKNLGLVESVVFRCSTCGNIQAFVKGEVKT